MNQTKTVESIIAEHPKWSNELSLLRSILNETELEETIKWGIPTYTINNKNVVGLAGFKNHFALWFFNGCFLSDNKKLLVNAQEGKTKGMRHLRFTNEADIKKKVVKEYLLEAIENQKAGKEIKPQRKVLKQAEVMKEAFSTNKSLLLAFEKLSKGKQKDYIEYVATAKRESTRLSRMEKIKPMIESGVGLNDKYKR